MADLRNLAASARTTALIAAPYVTGDGWNAFAEALKFPDSIRIDLLSCLRVESAASGSLDLRTLAQAHRSVPNLTVRHIEHLHGKVYVADGERAIVTSGNLTAASLLRNKEYGVRIADTPLAATIDADIREYGGLGTEVPPEALAELADLASEYDASASAARGGELQRRYDWRLRCLRGDSATSRTGVFVKTVRHLLRRESLRTVELYPLVQRIHPDLCNDDELRIIRGVRFGARWKHDVRNAQSQLKTKGVIVRRSDGRWVLIAPSDRRRAEAAGGRRSRSRS